jgi:hypothetical protein
MPFTKSKLFAAGPLTAGVPRGASPALSAIPAPAASAITAQRGIVDHYRGSALTANVRPKLKLEVVVDDKDKPLVVETILKQTRTGEIGDGKSS